jgi:hypothetical protein
MDFSRMMMFELFNTCVGGILRGRALAKVAEISERRRAESPDEDHDVCNPKFDSDQSRPPNAAGG